MPPHGLPLLGLYQARAADPARERLRGRAAPTRSPSDRGPLERLYGGAPDRLSREIRRVVLHEIAHHFGISDERLHELDRY